MSQKMTASNPETPPPSPPEYLQRILERQAALRETCVALFPVPAAITLELGCGHGHYLTAYAQAFPEESCLGVDLVTKRIAKATAKAEKRGLERLRFIKAEARELLEALPEHVSVAKIFMLFPDPWPKKRHHKNRMVQPNFLADLAQRSTPEARFFYRTDHAGYFEWTREILTEHLDWEITEEPWPFEERSFFQDLMDDWQSLVARRCQ